MEDLKKVPVIEVDKHNFEDLWPSILMAVKSATFVAFDLELSGLGDNIKLSASDLQHKYEILCAAAKSRCILSMGLSCYQIQQQRSTADANTSRCMQFLAQTFNIYCFCTESFVMEPGAVSFLLSHGFDFNRQLYKGVPYKRGNDEHQIQKCKTASQDQSSGSTINSVNSASVRQLFNALILANKPVVVHNGFLDLVFIYHNFYAEIPSKVSSFLCDLYQMFPAGIYDTKLLMRKSLYIKASYLEYGFRKSQCDNIDNYEQGKRYVSLCFIPYPSTCEYVQYNYCSIQRITHTANARSTKERIDICQHFAQFGWCKTMECKKSHNVYEILVQEKVDELKQAERRHKKKLLKERKKAALALCDNVQYENGEKNSTDQMVKRAKCDNDANLSQKESGALEVSGDSKRKDSFMGTCSDVSDSESGSGVIVTDGQSTNKHTSGFDAFMTGYVMSHYMCQECKQESTAAPTANFTNMFGTSDYKNKVHYKFEGPPIRVVATNFAKPSNPHTEKFSRLTTEAMENNELSS